MWQLPASPTAFSAGRPPRTRDTAWTRTIDTLPLRRTTRVEAKRLAAFPAVAGCICSTTLALSVSPSRRGKKARPKQITQPRAFEPFGGVYARDWALRSQQDRPGPAVWKWLPGSAFLLAIAWHVTGNWTQTLVALNVLSFVLQCYWPPWEEQGILSIDTLQSPRSSHRLLASAFLHVNWPHLLVNMCSLWYFGRVLERAFGPGRFLMVYLGSAISCSLASLWAKRRGRGAQLPSVGASGGVLGICAALVLFQWRHGLPYGSIGLSLLLNLAIGLLWPEVDNCGHLGGALGGAAIAYLWGPRYLQLFGGLLVRDTPIVRWPFI